MGAVSRVRSAVTGRGDPSVEAHRAAAAAVNDLDVLAGLVRSCTACAELAATRGSVVVGDLPPNARLLIVGEAPGASEDRTGHPFVGRSGQLLDRLLSEAGLARTGVAVANVLKCRPPGNRAPRRGEARRCRPWLDRQVELLDPPLVLGLGSAAAAELLGPGTRIASARGRVHEVGGRGVLVSYHPSAALRFGPGGEPARALAADLVLTANELRRRHGGTL